MRYFHVFLLLIVSLGAAAQPRWEWACSLSGAYHSAARDIEVDPSGNIFVLQAVDGEFNAPPHQSMFITKYRPGGVREWTKFLPASISRLKSDAVGNVYISGTINGTVTEDGITYVDPVFISKFLPDGNIIFTRLITDGNPNAFGVTKAGECYLAGSIRNKLTIDGFTDSVRSFLQFKTFLLKLGTDGNASWLLTDTTKGSVERLAIGPSGNVHLLHHEIPEIYTPFASYRYCRYDANGREIFKSAHNFANGVYLGFEIDRDGNVYVHADYSSQYTNNPILMKFDSLLNKIWTKDLGEFDSDYFFDGGLAFDASNNVYVGGSIGGEYAADTIRLGSNRFLNDGGRDLAVVVLRNDSGSVLWAKRASGTGDDYALDLSNDATGNCYVAGVFNAGDFSFHDNLQLDQLLLDQSGSYCSGVVAKLLGPELPAALGGPTSVSRKVSFFPQPSTGFVNIKSPDNLSGLPFTITDPFGRCVFRGMVGPLGLDLHGLATSLYYVDILGDGIRYKGKLLLNGDK